MKNYDERTPWFYKRDFILPFGDKFCSHPQKCVFNSIMMGIMKYLTKASNYFAINPHVSDKLQH